MIHIGIMVGVLDVIGILVVYSVKVPQREWEEELLELERCRIAKITTWTPWKATF